MNIRRFFWFAIFILLTAYVFAQATSQTNTLATDKERVHVIAQGETLYSIARLYGLSYQDLLIFNNISDPTKLQVGQKIKIPPEIPETPVQKTVQHTVLRGETLFGIARQYGTTVAELQAKNGLSEKSILKEGTILIIPITEEKTTSSSQNTSESILKSTVQTTQEKTVEQAISWPIHAKEISYMTGKLYGVVIIGEEAESVKSLTPGIVVSTGPYRGFGKVVIVQTETGYVYVYGGCEMLSVKEGDRVQTGTELGRLGIDAISKKPQLFFLVYNDNKAIDPAKAPRS